MRASGPSGFLREIQIAAKLHHPHIVPLYDSGRIDELLYYVMPYVEGESLRERLNRERYLPVGDAVTIATEVCDALSYAHSLGVVHRDLKPENILLESGHALVADFGVGRAIAAAGVETLTATGLAVGTPGYMSPEQAHGEKEIDQRSDIYSLGCVVYEMLAGEPPFTGISARAVMARHSIDPVPSVRTVRPTVPAALEAAVTRALAKVPADRPQTALEFSEALTRSGLAPLNAEGPAVRRGAAITAVVQTVVALARAAGAWMRVPRRLSLVPARVVVGVFENKSGDSSLDVLGNVATDWLTDGIQRIEGIEVLPAKFTLSLGSRSINVRDLAEATGAGTVVSGTYYTRNDSLTFHAHIVDARTGRLIHSLDPVVGPEQRRMDVIDSLRERVLGALALHFGAPRHVAEKGGSPPTFAAYQNYLEGVRRANEFRYRDAITHLDAALALDATFLGAWFTKGDVHYNLAGLTAATVGLSDPEVASQFAAGDAAFRVLQDARDHLSPAQRHYLDWQDAMHRGDLSGALRAARKMSAVAPDPGSRSLEALSAVRVNRFREAIKVLQAAGEPDWGWAVGTEAYHMLADHRRELSGARQARQHHPDLPLTMSLELRALAALGRLKEVNDLLDEGMSLAPQPGRGRAGPWPHLGDWSCVPMAIPHRPTKYCSDRSIGTDEGSPSPMHLESTGTGLHAACRGQGNGRRRVTTSFVSWRRLPATSTAWVMWGSPQLGTETTLKHCGSAGRWRDSPAPTRYSVNRPSGARESQLFLESAMKRSVWCGKRSVRAYSPWTLRKDLGTRHGFTAIPTLRCSATTRRLEPSSRRGSSRSRREARSRQRTINTRSPPRG